MCSMKKLKCIFIICILCCVAGCSDCAFVTECAEDEKLPTYTNKSEIMVKIIAIEPGYDINGKIYRYYEKFIANNDTLHYPEEREWDIPHNWNCGLAATKYCEEPIRMKLHFLDEPEKCLIFEGLIKHDGIDMRSWKSYKKGKIIDNWADFWLGVEYVYTITPEHRAMAKEEDCQ